MENKLKRVGHVGVVYQDHLVVWGGYLEYIVHDGRTTTYHDPQEILIYNPVTNTWVTKSTSGNVPPANSGASGVVVQNFLYIYGGYYGDPDIEGNTNNLYRLDFKSLMWKALEPEGCKPLHRDKLLGWEYRNKLYFFGGFGTPPVNRDHYQNRYEYVLDTSHTWYIRRGWNNQLIVYNIETNEWEVPKTNGQTPSPRAALAGFRSQSKVYIFGGRLQRARMNDLYVLDLETMTWSENLNLGQFGPRGRSWHSFTLISPTKAILYGGVSTEGEVLGDCWMYNVKMNTWSQIPLKEQDQRLWHQSVCIQHEVIVVGGVLNNISNHRCPAIFADNLLSIVISPKSLLRLCLETCAANFTSLKPFLFCLPVGLQKVLEERKKSIQ